MSEEVPLDIYLDARQDSVPAEEFVTAATAQPSEIEQVDEEPKYKLDIACGQHKQAGFVGVDISPCEGVDIVYDLEQFPWTFAEDNSVDEAFVSHYIEHTKDLIKFMNELHRILKPGGKVTMVAPYYTSIRCWQDPTHTRAISEATFLYYNQDWLKQNGLDHYPITANFDFNFGYSLDEEYENKADEVKQFAIRHYWNVVHDIHVFLTKK